MPWITVPDVKKHLQKTTNVDDEELVGFVAAACAIVEDIKGHVDVVTVTGEPHLAPWRYYGHRHEVDPWRRHSIELLETPVLQVVSVAMVAGNGITTPVLANDSVAGTIGWELRDSLLYVPSPGDYVVTYTAGRDPVPGNFRMAALELAGHLWRASQLNKTTGRQPAQGDQTAVVPGAASALPYRVRELLGLFGAIVNDHVVIA